MRAHILRIDSSLLALDILPKEGSDLDGGGLTARQVLDQILKGDTGVENILDNQHVTTLDIDIEVFDDANDARRLSAVAIARHGHKIDGKRAIDSAHEVAHEHNGAAKNGDEHKVFILVVLADLRTDALYHCGDFFLGKENVIDIGMHGFHDGPFWLVNP